MSVYIRLFSFPQTNICVLSFVKELSPLSQMAPQKLLMALEQQIKGAECSEQWIF